jgi:class 3 adenylate cyclase
MSPEQAQGGAVDARSDLWSLGVVFYEILTDRLPFPGDNEQAVIYAIINRTPLPVREINREIPLEVENLIFKCLSKKPDDRYVSAKSLLLELSRFSQASEYGRVGAEGIAAEKPESQREAERRQATVMSIAVEGFSEILERTGGEEGALTLHRCSQFIESELKKYGGHIERVAPGNILALFGVPRAMEDAPQRAINAAIALRKNFDLFIQKEIPLCPARLRIGISTGIIIAGGVGATGKEEYPVMGEAVAHSSALKDLAPPQKIYVGSSTYRLTKDEFAFRALEPLHPKDKKQPLSAFEVLSQEEHFQRPRLGAERAIYSEMVGRETELNKLKLQVMKAVTGQGSIVDIIGEAGIGKSRLVNELCRIEEMKTVMLLVGRGLSGGQNLSFHPLIEILKSWAGIRIDDDLEASSRKLERAVRSVDPDGMTEIYPFIAKILGLELSGKYAERVKGIQGEALERLILRTLRELLIKASQIRPVVLIIEDLHWADPSSIELLESLFRLAEQNRILFLNIFRPNYPETSDRILRTAQSRYAHFHFEIQLGPLSDNASGVLINNLLKSGVIQGPIRDLIAKRAEGNPFYIEEIARSLIDDGSVIIENGKFKATEKIHSVVIPETLADVIMARVDKLMKPRRPCSSWLP